MTLSVLMYPDADRVVGSCGEPRTKLATESKTASMKAGMEGMTCWTELGWLEDFAVGGGKLLAALFGLARPDISRICFGDE